LRFTSPAQQKAVFANLLRLAGKAGTHQRRVPLMRRHITELAKLHRIRVNVIPRTLIKVPGGKAVSSSQAWNRSIRGRRVRGIDVAKIANRTNYMIALHEIGHHVAPGAWLGARPNVLAAEARASKYALETSLFRPSRTQTRNIDRSIGTYWRAHVRKVQRQFNLPSVDRNLSDKVFERRLKVIKDKMVYPKKGSAERSVVVSGKHPDPYRHRELARSTASRLRRRTSVNKRNVRRVVVKKLRGGSSS